MDNAKKYFKIPKRMLEKDAYDWAVMVELSRGMGLEEISWRRMRNIPMDRNMKKEEKGVALFPMFDLINHKPLPRVLKG